MRINLRNKDWFIEGAAANLLLCKVAEHISEFLLIIHHSCSLAGDGLITEHITISSDLISTSEYLESDGTATWRNACIKIDYSCIT